MEGFDAECGNWNTCTVTVLIPVARGFTNTIYLGRKKGTNPSREFYESTDSFLIGTVPSKDKKEREPQA
jgi:hypothetical protein